jgi:hypothetical protein
METLHSDILTSLAADTDVQAHRETLRQTPCPDSKWSLSPTGFLLHEGAVYVPTGGDLQTRVLKACHDHPLVGHPGQMKTLELLHHDYYWPKMCDDCDCIGQIIHHLQMHKGPPTPAIRYAPTTSDSGTSMALRIHGLH